MAWTRRQFIQEAFTEIGMGSYVFNLSPQQLQSAKTRLDSMMATWNAKGVRLGYPLPSAPDLSDIDEDTGVPDRANEAIYLNLALKIAPLFGKTITRETKISADDAYDAMANLSNQPGIRQITGLPAGAGNKKWRDNGSPFLPPPTKPIQVGSDSDLEFE